MRGGGKHADADVRDVWEGECGTWEEGCRGDGEGGCWGCAAGCQGEAVRTDRYVYMDEVVDLRVNISQSTADSMRYKCLQGTISEWTDTTYRRPLEFQLSISL